MERNRIGGASPRRVYILCHEENTFYPRFFERMLQSRPMIIEVVGAAVVAQPAGRENVLRRIQRFDGLGGILRAVGCVGPARWCSGCDARG